LDGDKEPVSIARSNLRTQPRGTSSLFVQHVDLRPASSTFDFPQTTLQSFYNNGNSGNNDVCRKNRDVITDFRSSADLVTGSRWQCRELATRRRHRTGCGSASRGDDFLARCRHQRDCRPVQSRSVLEIVQWCKFIRRIRGLAVVHLSTICTSYRRNI
jgi:hypothetical protein